MSSHLWGEGLLDLRVFAQFLHFWCWVVITTALGRTGEQGRDKVLLTSVFISLWDHYHWNCLCGSFR